MPTATDTYSIARDWMFADFDHIDLNLILNASDYPDHWTFFGLDVYGSVFTVEPPIRYIVYQPRQPVDAVFFLQNIDHLIKELGFGAVFHDGAFVGLTIDGVGFDVTPYFQALYEFRYPDN